MGKKQGVLVGIRADSLEILQKDNSGITFSLNRFGIATLINIFSPPIHETTLYVTALTIQEWE